MLPETLSHLRNRELILGDRINRSEIADRCRAMLIEKPVESTDMNEIDDKAMIVPEIRHRVLGDAESEEVERELDAIITSLVGADGKVQEELENGYVLCAAQVTRRLDHNGHGSVTIRRRGRFVTSNADAIEEYYWNPAASRLTSSMKAVAKRLEIGARRQPQLQARRPLVIMRAHEQIRLELPAPEEQQ
jgi:hypothetical protein